MVVPAMPALAQEQPTEAMTVELRLVIPSNADLPPQLVATVRDDEGALVPGIVVVFSRELEFLGTKRLAVLGSATTDIGGTARLVVLPRQQEATLIASIPGGDVSEIIHETFPEERVDTFFDPDHEHGLLTPLRTVMPPVIGALVALFWVFVIGLVLSTVTRIRHLGEKDGGRIA